MSTRHALRWGMGALAFGILIGGPVEAKKPGCFDVAVLDPQSSRPRAARNGRYSVTEVIDLHFRVLFDSDIEEEGLVTLRLFTPNGHFYEELDVPFSREILESRARARPERRLVEGYPRPLKVERLESVPEPRKKGGRRGSSA